MADVSDFFAGKIEQVGLLQGSGLKGQAKMLVGGRSGHPAAGGADEKTGLNEKGFVHVFEGGFFLADSG
jgi:hypothetical protein